MNNLSTIIAALIISCIDIFCFSKLNGKKINFKSLEFFICLLLMSVVFIYSRYYIIPTFRIVLVIILFILINIFLFKNNLINSIVYSVLLEVLSVISEIFFVIGATLIFKGFSSNQIISFFESKIISNFIIGFLLYLFCINKYIIILTTKLKKICIEIKVTKLLLYSFILFISITIIFLMYYKLFFINNKVNLVLILFISLSYFLIIIISIIVENKYKKTLKKYDMTIQSLNEYERMIDKYKVINHENKNQLLIIRNMINSKESPIEFINELLKDRVNDDEKLMIETSIIPSGGLRAVVYSKLLKIKANGIDYNLEIDKNIRNYNMLEIDNSTLMDIYNIVNIFLDNAIEESINNVEKEIFIEMYKEDNIVINISNVIERKINLDLIKKAGYTSKSDGHGYGLSLVEKTINENRYLINETKIEDDLFIQSLIIKIK